MPATASTVRAISTFKVIFSLVADRHAGYTFDDRHTHARLGFFYRKAGTQTSSADGANSKPNVFI